MSIRLSVLLLMTKLFALFYGYLKLVLSVSVFLIGFFSIIDSDLNAIVYFILILLMLMAILLFNRKIQHAGSCLQIIKYASKLEITMRGSFVGKDDRFIFEKFRESLGEAYEKIKRSKSVKPVYICTHSTLAKGALKQLYKYKGQSYGNKQWEEDCQNHKSSRYDGITIVIEKKHTRKNMMAASRYSFGDLQKKSEEIMKELEFYKLVVPGEFFIETSDR